MVILSIFHPIWLKFGLKVPSDAVTGNTYQNLVALLNIKLPKKFFRFVKILKKKSRQKSLRGLPDPD